MHAITTNSAAKQIDTYISQTDANKQGGIYTSQ